MPRAAMHEGRESERQQAPIILVFGMPRSGTTWVGKVMDSHPGTLYRHEPDSGGTLNSIPLFAEPGEAEVYRHDVCAFLAALPEMRSVRVAGKLPIFRKWSQSGVQHQLRKAALLWSKVKNRYGGEATVPEFLDESGRGKFQVVWKSIESLGRMGVIVRILPESKVIHLIRHPCGYVASILRGEREGRFSDRVASSDDYGIFNLLVGTEPARRRGLTVQAFRKMLAIERLAWRWVLYNEKAMDDLDGFDQLQLVCYEKLCQEPEKEFRRLFAFCGLSWEFQTEEFIRDSCRDADPGYYSLTRHPAKAANRWREELTSEDVQRVMRIAAVSRPGQLYSTMTGPVAKARYGASGS